MYLNMLLIGFLPMPKTIAKEEEVIADPIPLETIYPESMLSYDQYGKLARLDLDGATIIGSLPCFNAATKLTALTCGISPEDPNQPKHD